jgi:hypothetical protein
VRTPWPSPGNLQVRKTAWWAREDSNLQPERYERSALTVELRVGGRTRRARFVGPANCGSDGGRSAIITG